MSRFVVLMVVLFANDVYAQVKPVAFAQIGALQNKEERLVMVLIETDWCKYCQAMKHTMQKDKRVGTILNKYFYTVFLNAESKNQIRFAGKLFNYTPTGINTGVHQLAEQLGTVNGQLSFPSLCFLNKKNEIVYQYSGFLDPTSLVKMLNVLVNN